MPDLDRHHERTRRRGVNAPVYWLVRAVIEPALLLYFWLGRHGRAHIPRSGPVLLASNHRSFLDPFVIGCCVRRPIYFVAKRELFERRFQGWLLNALGAFPVRRDESDEEAMKTARALLRKGEVVVMFPEGTRMRRGPLGRPRRGIGRLALETGAPVVPVAVLGSERSRRPWRERGHGHARGRLRRPWLGREPGGSESERRALIPRPCRVRVRCGPPLAFPSVPEPSQRLAAAVTARIWPCVALQWEWLGGMPPLRRVAVVGAGPMGRALAGRLVEAGVDVQLGCRSRAKALSLAEEDGAGRRSRAVADLDFEGVDLVALAVPSRDLPAVVGELGARIGGGTGVLVLSKGLVPPLGATPTRYVRDRLRGRPTAWLGGPAHANEMASDGASVVLAAEDRAFSARLARALRAAGIDVEETGDVLGAELAGCAKNVAALAAAAAAPAGMNAAGAAAGLVFSEVHALARGRGAGERSFTGLAGAGDLVATALAPGSRNRRAGELLGRGVPREEIAATLGGTAEALDAAPLLATLLRSEGVAATAATGLSELVEGRASASEWLDLVRSAPKASRRAA
jgi:1-acyl-sn-glycerol-3-phosphate acyltransferase